MKFSLFGYEIVFKRKHVSEVNKCQFCKSGDFFMAVMNTDESSKILVCPKCLKNTLHRIKQARKSAMCIKDVHA